MSNYCVIILLKQLAETKYRNLANVEYEIVIPLII